MSESFCVENVSYIYYSGENRSIPNGPKCHSCMNQTLHSGGLNDIDQVSIITTSGVVPFPIRSLTCLYGMTSPFSIKDMAEVPLLMNCLQCCLNNSTRDAPANLASTDAGLVAQEVLECVEKDPPRTEETANLTLEVGITDLEAVQPENLMDHSQRRKLLASEDVCATKKVKVEDDENSHAIHSTNAIIIDGECNPGYSHAELAQKAVESAIPEVSLQDGPPKESANSNGDPLVSTITARLAERPVTAELQKPKTCRNSLDSTTRRQKRILDNIAYLLDSVDELNKGSKNHEFLGFKIHKQFRDSEESKEFESKVVDLIFEKVLQHPEHSKLYAHLCKIQVNSESADVNKSDFSHLLIKHAEKIVGIRKSKDSKVQFPVQPGSENDGSKKCQRRNLANVIFIGNLLNLGLVKEILIEYFVCDLIKVTEGPLFPFIPKPPYNEDHFILVARMFFEIQEGKLSAEYRRQLCQYLKRVALKCSDKTKRIILMCIRDAHTVKSLERKVAERTELERQLFIDWNLV